MTSEQGLWVERQRIVIINAVTVVLCLWIVLMIIPDLHYEVPWVADQASNQEQGLVTTHNNKYLFTFKESWWGEIL